MYLRGTLQSIVAARPLVHVVFLQGEATQDAKSDSLPLHEILLIKNPPGPLPNKDPSRTETFLQIKSYLLIIGKGKKRFFDKYF